MMYNNFKNAQNNKKSVDLNTIIRDMFGETGDWQPHVKKISSDDIKKFEKKEERKIRYDRRKK
jgi:hypothetical protein